MVRAGSLGAIHVLSMRVACIFRTDSSAGSKVLRYHCRHDARAVLGRHSRRKK